MPTYKLLDEFEHLFRGAVYKHRVSTNGDQVAGYLYEDVFELGRSPKLCARVPAHTRVLNKSNKATGKRARRGDGTFGERVPSSTPQMFPGLSVARASVATIEIGIEVKILAKAMIKQIDRVCSDMRNQAAEFRKHHKDAICVGIVGINHAAKYTSYEGKNKWPTDGRKYVHPIQEAADAEKRVRADAAPAFDELVILRFDATNATPFPFKWVGTGATQAADYSAALVRISRLYEGRFP